MPLSNRTPPLIASRVAAMVLGGTVLPCDGISGGRLVQLTMAGTVVLGASKIIDRTSIISHRHQAKIQYRDSEPIALQHEQVSRLMS